MKTIFCCSVFFLPTTLYQRYGVSFALNRSNPAKFKQQRICTSFLKREKQFDTAEDNNHQSYYKLPRINWTGVLQENQDITIANDNAHYLSNVMRVKAGYMFRVFNVMHGEYLCRIKSISKSKHTDSISCQVLRQLRQTQESYILPCTLLCAAIKKPRLKILLEKVTELGVQDIVLLVTQNTIADRMERDDDDSIRSYQSILVQSAEQSERLSVPTLHTYITLSDLLKFVQLSPESADSTDGSNSFPHNVLNLFQTIFVCVERSDGNNQHLLTSFQQFITESGSSSSGDSGCGSGSNSSSNNYEVRPFAILIGPEGGFTAEEMEQIRLVQSISPNKIRLVSLGGTVLRSETAAISALSVVTAAADAFIHR